MDTGFGTNQLYSACRLEITHYFPEDDIECEPFNGTGFLVEFPTGDNRIALVTNRHLADAELYNEVEYKGATIKSVKLQWWQSKSLRLEHTIDTPLPCYHDDPSIDVAIIPIAAKPDEPVVITSTLFGDTAEWIKNQDTDQLIFNHAFSWEYLLKCEQLWPQIQPGDFVSFPGYPIWYDRLQIRPVLRSGMIASDPQTDYRLTEGDPTRTDGNQQVLFDAFSTKGNSGSPIFVAQQGLPPINLNLPPLIQGTPPLRGKLNFTGYRRSFLIGINNGHHDDPGSPRANDHAGLSRMHKLSAILDVLRSKTAPHDMSVREIRFLLPVPEDAKDRVRAETAARNKAIISLRKGGKSLRAIAAEVGCSVSTVGRVIKQRT
ncbi:helix-turn-helix domain-containing protein [Mycobacterium asiaticum]|uniref:helix-turn-helix domain-containing protein n=1 Tax=Mycobacterium asiaticum TaxID=1790 RepID=UPI0007EF4F7B|nr:helix-turn-helix domain-containing protein [Mycobacterium asiaticum]OBI88141.1 hypothetical protein A5661_06215 [Mycobacterium asiaticum]